MGHFSHSWGRGGWRIESKKICANVCCSSNNKKSQIHWHKANRTGGLGVVFTITTTWQQQQQQHQDQCNSQQNAKYIFHTGLLLLVISSFWCASSCECHYLYHSSLSFQDKPWQLLCRCRFANGARRWQEGVEEEGEKMRRNCFCFRFDVWNSGAQTPTIWTGAAGTHSANALAHPVHVQTQFFALSACNGLRGASG